MEPARHLDSLRIDAPALLASAAGALDRDVPSCPGWDVRQLIVHLGLVWQWATDIVDSGARAGWAQAPSTSDEGALIDWARARSEHLVASLGAADPDSSCWTFGLPRTRRFWIRRQALETALHRFDVEQASGEPTPLQADIAADGVDELLVVLLPRLVAAAPDAWNGESLHLHRTDGQGEWVVRLGPGKSATAERAHARCDVAVRGSAPALWLWCTNRPAEHAGGVELIGDPRFAERWASTITF